jgi:DNA helicase-2/ATP-dependent DNA helicase PcrA
MEEGLFPLSRTLNEPDQMEEERRLCYVGLTRAMDTLILTRARYRRRYGNDMPDNSLPSRFLEEIPTHLIEDLSGAGRPVSTWNNYERYGGYGSRSNRGDYDESPTRHYSYEDEDQSATPRADSRRYPQRPAKPGNSLDNIAQFFSQRGVSVPQSRPKLDIPAPAGKTGLKSGQRVRHPKYGEGVVFRREGDGEDAKVTVQFSKFGVKKLVEKFAQLERL